MKRARDASQRGRHREGYSFGAQDRRGKEDQENEYARRLMNRERNERNERNVREAPLPRASLSQRQSHSSVGTAGSYSRDGPAAALTLSEEVQRLSRHLHEQASAAAAALNV